MFESSRYFFNPHSLPLFIAAVLIALLGIRTLMAKKSVVTWHFSAICLSVFVWLVFTGIGYMVKEDVGLARFWFTLDWVGVSFISISVYSFSTHLLGLERKKSILLGYVLAIIFSVVTLSGNPLLAGVKRYSWGFFPLRDHVWSSVFLAFFFMYMGQAFTDYIVSYRKCKDPVKKNQIKYMFAGFVVAYMGSVDYLPTYGYEAYPFGFILITIFVAITGYAIAQHRLMDISVIIRKTLIYSVVTTTLTAIYLVTVAAFAHVFEGLAGYQTIFSSAVAAGLITLGFQPLRKRVQTFVDAKFFRQYVDREEKLYELSREVITHTTPEAMGIALMHVIDETLHPKISALYLRASSGSGFERASGRNDSELPIRLDEDHVLAAYFKDNPQPFLQDMAGDLGRSYSTRLKDEREDVA